MGPVWNKGQSAQDLQSDGPDVGKGAARQAPSGAARQSGVASTASSQTHKPSPAIGPLKVEWPAAPLVVSSYVSTNEFREPHAGQEEFAACLDSEKPRVIAIRAIKRLPCFLAHCIGSRLSSEAYDNTENHPAEENRPVEDLKFKCSEDLQREPLIKTCFFT